jgi:hypothetical protein
MSLGRGVVPIVVLLMPGLMLLPAWRLSGLGADEDDILYYLPSRTLLHEMAQRGEPPWLNPWTGLDRPYLADPQSAVFYPATWLFALLPPLRAYPLSLWLHYSLALAGMYRLMRGEGLNRPASLLAGVVFAFGGFLLAHRAHFAMQHAAAWTPWVFWTLGRYCAHTDPSRGSAARRLGVAALACGLQVLAGHVQIAALTALGSLVWLAAREPRRAAAVTRWLMTWVCAAGLTAVQWLPTYAYVRECTRGDRTYVDFVENSWSPLSASTLLLPMLFGQRTPNFFGGPWWGPSHQSEQFAYVGVVPLALAVVAVRAGWRGRERTGWLALLVSALLLALGGLGPICPLLYWLPGANLFRVPARGLLLVNLALAALAGGALHALAGRVSPQRARLRAAALQLGARPLAWAAVLVGLGGATAAVQLILLDGRARSDVLSWLRPWSPAVWVAAVFVLSGLALLHGVARRWKQPRLTALLLLHAVLDLGVIAWSIDVPRRVQRAEDLLSSPDRDAWLAEVRRATGRLWVIAPRAAPSDFPGEYHDPIGKGASNTNILAGVASLSDYGPLQPRRFAEAFPLKPWGETVDAEARLRDPSWRRVFDVAWVLLCGPDPPLPEGCQAVLTTPSGYRLVRNPDAAGPAFLEDPVRGGVLRYEPRSGSDFMLRVALREPEEGRPAAAARVVVSRLALPGWRAETAGRTVPIEAGGDGLMRVTVADGQPVELRFRYFPPGLIAGATISALTAFVLTWGAVRGVLRRPASAAGTYTRARRRGGPGAKRRATAR